MVRWLDLYIIFVNLFIHKKIAGRWGMRGGYDKLPSREVGNLYSFDSGINRGTVNHKNIQYLT